MKVKLKLDKQAIGQFFLQHGEKIAFGALSVLSLLILYGAVSHAGYEKKPSALQEAVNSAKQNMENGKAPEPPPVATTDFEKIVRKDPDTIQIDAYRHAVLWDPPLPNPSERRKTPKILPVEQLTATAGHGAFKGSRAATDSAAGHRWVLLTGVLPIREQREVYKDCFAMATVKTPDDEPKFGGFFVYRAEVSDGAKPENLKWEGPWKSNAELLKVKDVPAQAESLDPRMKDPILTFPLPQLADASWGSDTYPEALAGPPFEKVRLDPESFKGKKVTWVAETAQVDSRNTKRLVFARNRSVDGVSQEHFAADFATSELAKQYAKPGSITGVVTGAEKLNGEDSKEETIPVLKFSEGSAEAKEESPGANPLPGETDVFGAAGGAAGAPPARAGAAPPKPPAAKSVEYLLFRYLDLTVQPGKRYVYRVQVGANNPNFGVAAKYLDTPSAGEKPYLFSDLENSPISKSVAVPPDIHFLALQVTPPKPSSPEPKANMAVVKWELANGQEAFREFDGLRGFVPDFRGETFPPSSKGKKKGEEDKLPADVGAATGGMVPFTLDYITDAVVLDIRGGGQLPGRDKAVESGEVLVLDGNGKFSMRSEIEDRAELTKRQEALKPKAAGTPAVR